jgi:hypothetical protein
MFVVLSLSAALHGTHFSTASSSIGTSVQVSAELEIPEIGSIGTEVTTTATFTSTTASGYDDLLDSRSCADTVSTVSQHRLMDR